MAAENNLIKKTDLARVREIEFTEMFGYSIKKLMEALGVTRKIPKQAGAVLKTYKATGTLESGTVAEGDTIPLSKYTTYAVPYKEITLKKWRKATSAEAITDRGYDQAVEMTTDEMLKDVQKGIRKSFFDFLSTGTGAVSGKTTFPFDGGTVQAGALVGRQVLIGNACVTVTANTASSMTVDAAVTAEDNAIIYPGEAGAQGRDVYVTLVLGADGYGTTEITGGGLEHIVKQLGSAGTGDPLNQRASVGWKATKVAVRLDDSAIRRIETCSTYTE